ncbi:MAG: hypothetical protein JW953_03525 [Anaerolineae bacterium]|nr:hypothetical protein [Anaerolineae bacterium]
MQLDWFTIVAEIVNFLILVALLKYFLYDRIIGIADEREEKIAARFAEAEDKRQEAEDKAESFQAKQGELNEKQDQLFSQAKEEAEKQRRELLEKARQEVEAQKRQWQQMVQQEQDSFLQELRRQAGQQTIALARRSLADLADAELETQMVERFVEQVKNLSDQEQTKMAGSLADSGRKPVITTAFDLSSESRRQLLDAVQTQFGDELEGKFNTADELICGIELKANGYKIAWSLDNYLDNLADNLARTLQNEMPRQEEASRKETKTDAG